MPGAIVIFTFDTTHQALWAEDIALEKGIPVETAPAPPAANAKCGIALRAASERTEELVALFEEEGIDFGRFKE
jgi:hypothetical protein